MNWMPRTHGAAVVLGLVCAGSWTAYTDERHRLEPDGPDAGVIREIQLAPIVSAATGGGVTVRPGTGQLSLEGFAPTVVVSRASTK